MRKSDLRKNHEQFDHSVKRYRAFMERIAAAQRVVRSAQEKRDVAESVLLRLCANWEKFLDEHLVDLVNRYPSNLSAYFSVTIPPHPSWDLCHALIIGAGYNDFRSYGELKKFSRKLLADPVNPFLVVGKKTAAQIDECFTIRNYLSHYSAASRKKLRKMYRDVYKLSRFREPGQFLMANKAVRLWGYFDAFALASTQMQASYATRSKKPGMRG